MELEKDLREEIRLDKVLRQLRAQLFESQPKLSKAAKREKDKAEHEEILNKSHKVPFEKRSLLLKNLLKLKLLRPQLQNISDLAFDALDADNSGSLDAQELHDMVTMITA